MPWKGYGAPGPDLVISRGTVPTNIAGSSPFATDSCLSHKSRLPAIDIKVSQIGLGLKCPRIEEVSRLGHIQNKPPEAEDTFTDTDDQGRSNGTPVPDHTDQTTLVRFKQENSPLSKSGLFITVPIRTGVCFGRAARRD